MAGVRDVAPFKYRAFWRGLRWAPKSFRIATKGGGREVHGVASGHLGVHHEPGEMVLTHLPSGLRWPNAFLTATRAQSRAGEVVELVGGMKACATPDAKDFAKTVDAAYAAKRRGEG